MLIVFYPNHFLTTKQETQKFFLAFGISWAEPRFSISKILCYQGYFRFGFLPKIFTPARPSGTFFISASHINGDTAASDFIGAH